MKRIATMIVTISVLLCATRGAADGIEPSSADADALTLSAWRSLYADILRATDSGSTWPRAAALMEQANRTLALGAIPIACVFADRRSAFPGPLRDVRRPVSGQTAAAPPSGGREYLFAAAALKDRTHRGEQVAFVTGGPWYLAADPRGPRFLEIDFADGRGFRPVAAGERAVVSYESTGRKEIIVRGRVADGSEISASFYFHVEHLQTPSPDDTLSIDATIPYRGGIASGSAYLYLADTHTALENPILVIEGFDIDNTMGWDELYQHLNQENLVETLRGEGHDLVILDFADATDYIQRNAFVLVELIGQVTASIDPQRSIAIVGASMGGLVARYALSYMEAHAIEHRTALLVSFDSPHRGANIPLGIQYWMDFFSGQSADAAFMLERLDTPAARQMLVYHHTDPPGSTGECDSLRTVLLDDFASLGGYPDIPRRVAVANGSGSQIGQGFLPGEQIILYEYSSLLVDIVGNVWAVPDASSHVIFDGLIDMIWPLPDDAMTVSVSGTHPYDDAPGGTRASMAQMDTSEVDYGDIVALYEHHCFIPTISALDIDTDDPWYDIDGDPDIMSRTPFDTIYYPAENQEHVAITAENAAWFLSEIHGAITAVPEGEMPPGFVLHQNFPNPFNPATTIVFDLPRPVRVELAVFDPTGRRIRTLWSGMRTSGRHTIVWDGTNGAGRRVASGIYFCRLVAGSSTATKKMVLLH